MGRKTLWISEYDASNGKWKKISAFHCNNQLWVVCCKYYEIEHLNDKQTWDIPTD